MATAITFNGTSYSVPATGERAWGTSLSAYLVAISAGALQKTGGSFTLSAADVDFGATYGLKAVKFASRNTPATTGIFRLGNAESVVWRNAANGADLALKVNASNVLEFNGTPIVTLALGSADTALRMNAGGTAYEWAKIANANIDTAAAIAHSKLASITAGSVLMGNGSNVATETVLSGDVTVNSSGVTAIGSGVIVNADVSGSAAIAYSKLNLATSIVNADVSGSAAIAYSKLNLATSIVNADVSGSAAIAYSKLNLATSIVNADVNASAAIAYSKLNLASSIVNADVAAAAAIAHTKLADITAGRVLMGNGSNVPTATAVTGDVTINSSGVTAIGPGVIVNADVSASAAIDGTKIFPQFFQSIGGYSLTLSAGSGNGYIALAEQDTDPSTPASGYVRVYAGTDKKLYLKNSDGTETAVGSGAGEKNYIAGSSTAAGWSNIGDLDVATTTTAIELPREHTTASGIKITADSNTQSAADYVYYDFTLDDVDLSKKLKIKWDQKTTGTYTAGQLEVVITTQADRTTALHTPVNTAIPAADGTFVSSFDTGTTATLSLVIRATTDMTTDGGIVISDVVVGPGVQATGAALSGPTTWTPTLTGLTGGSATVSGTYWQVGTRMVGRIFMDATTVFTGGSDAIFSLPSGLTIDTSAFPTAPVSSVTRLGTAEFRDVGTALYYGVALYSSTTAIMARPNTDDVGVSTNHLSESAVTTTVPFTWVNGDDVYVEFDVPIAEWAGSGTVNLAQNDVEYAYNSGTWDAADTTSFAYGPAGGTMAGALTTTRTKRVRFQTPIQPTDRIEVELSETGTVWGSISGFVDTTGAFLAVNALSASGGLSSSSGAYWRPVSGSTTDLDVAFARYSSVANDDAPVGDWQSGWKWRVRKISGGQAVGFGLATYQNAGLISKQATGSTATTFAGNLGGSASASYTLRYQRVGDWVTLYVPAMTITPASSSTKLVAATAISDTWARPSATQSCALPEVINNSVLTTAVGMCRVLSTGVVEIYRDPVATAFSNAAAGTNSAMTVTYWVG